MWFKLTRSALLNPRKGGAYDCQNLEWNSFCDISGLMCDPDTVQWTSIRVSEMVKTCRTRFEREAYLPKPFTWSSRLLNKKNPVSVNPVLHVDLTTIVPPRAILAPRARKSELPRARANLSLAIPPQKNQLMSKGSEIKFGISKVNLGKVAQSSTARYILNERKIEDLPWTPIEDSTSRTWSKEASSRRRRLSRHVTCDGMRSLRPSQLGAEPVHAKEIQLFTDVNPDNSAGSSSAGAKLQRAWSSLPYEKSPYMSHHWCDTSHRSRSDNDSWLLIESLIPLLIKLIFTGDHQRKFARARVPKFGFARTRGQNRAGRNMPSAQNMLT
ncbi:hypothetical protein B0H11DRAFT_1913050 [Mycena galericulata]|nr:hypothetical protein B0H11DRAFT_1913050 [Mycena galericulata]